MKGDGKRCVLGTAHDKMVNRITNCPLQQVTCKGHPIKALRRTLREANKVCAGRRFPYLKSLHQADACCSLSNDSLQRFATLDSDIHQTINTLRNRTCRRRVPKWKLQPTAALTGPYPTHMRSPHPHKMTHH